MYRKKVLIFVSLTTFIFGDCVSGLNFCGGQEVPTLSLNSEILSLIPNSSNDDELFKIENRFERASKIREYGVRNAGDPDALDFLLQGLEHDSNLTVSSTLSAIASVGIYNKVLHNRLVNLVKSDPVMSSNVINCLSVIIREEENLRAVLNEFSQYKLDEYGEIIFSVKYIQLHNRKVDYDEVEKQRYLTGLNKLENSLTTKDVDHRLFTISVCEFLPTQILISLRPYIAESVGHPIEVLRRKATFLIKYSKGNVLAECIHIAEKASRVQEIERNILTNSLSGMLVLEDEVVGTWSDEERRQLKTKVSKIKPTNENEKNLRKILCKLNP